MVGYHQPLGVRSALEIGFGGSVGILSRSTGSAYIDAQGNVGELNNTYKLTGVISGRASLKYLYHLNTRNMLYVEPWINFGFSNFSQNSVPYKSYLNYGGVRIGYRFRF